MNQTQKDFIRNMTPAQAQAVLRKFRQDPEVAHRRSEAALSAFRAAWEKLYPTEYWQVADLAGGVQYNLISVD